MYIWVCVRLYIVVCNYTDLQRQRKRDSDSFSFDHTDLKAMEKRLMCVLI